MLEVVVIPFDAAVQVRARLNCWPLVIPGRASWRRPGIRKRAQVYRSRVRASKSAVAGLDNNIAERG